jgi:glucose/arabinose dehydrogenase
LLVVRDSDGNGRADPLSQPLLRLTDLRDAAYFDDYLYVASSSSVFRVHIDKDGKSGPLRRIIDSSSGLEIHSIGVGPDGNLYMSAGDEEGEKIYVARRDGRRLRAWATGLQKTIAFAWRPEDKNLWGYDLSPTGSPEENQPEELNLLRAKRNYGWPPCDSQKRPRAHCPNATPPSLTFPAQSGGFSMLFYEGSHLPVDYRGDALVALLGEKKIVRVSFEQGRPQKTIDFVTGFDRGPSGSENGRPSCLGLAADGSLLIGDDVNGAIYRLSYDSPPGR